MKSIYVFVALMITGFIVDAQDEGDVVVKKRFERDKTVYVSLGPSFTLGKNLGDYSTGFNFEAGFLKRTNKLISIGPNLSYLFFAYDASKTFPDYYVLKDNNGNSDYTINLKFTGGDVSILTLGFNVKLNFIPVSDNTKFSAYGFANPFIGSATRSEIAGTAIINFNNGYNVYNYYPQVIPLTKDDVDGFKSETTFTGGINAGFGFEFRPARRISFFGQVTFSYTLPINYVATEQFLKGKPVYTSADKRTYYYSDKTLSDEKFPNVNSGFSAVSIKFGAAFNF